MTMDQIEEVVEKINNEYAYLAGGDGPELNSEKALVRRVLLFALKQQDRETRHACAEAVNTLHRTVSQCVTVDYCKGYNHAVESAHDACMNAKAI